MKNWTRPVVEEVDVKVTEYAPEGGTRPDGEYISIDGEFLKYSYGPSSGDHGDPSIVVE